MFWDPFEELIDEIERMRKRMKKLFKTFPSMRAELETFPVDVYESDEELIIRADLPGFEKDEISVKVFEDSVDIRAAKKERVEEKREGYYRAERRFGAVRRVIPLPVEVEPESAKAKLEKGVLEIRVRKAKVKKGKELKIE